MLRSPAAIVWPDGRVRVFAQLGNGTLGILGQRGGTVKARWSAWAAAGAMLGSPAVWVSAAGVLGTAVLAAAGAMAAATYRNGSWTALAQLGGQFQASAVPRPLRAAGAGVTC